MDSLFRFVAFGLSRAAGPVIRTRLYSEMMPMKDTFHFSENESKSRESVRVIFLRCVEIIVVASM